MTSPLFHPNFGGVPFPMDGPDQVSTSINLKLTSREIIFEVFQPMWSRYLNIAYRQTDGQTDGRTDDTTYCGITALCVASRGKNALLLLI